MTIPESDWKVFKQLRANALERMCQQILDESRAILDNEDKSAHERYVELLHLLPERKKDVASCFDHFSRSWATMDLRFMRNWGLVTEDEVAQLSEETEKHTRPGEIP